MYFRRDLVESLIFELWPEILNFFAETLFYRSILWNYWSIHVIFDKRKMCFIAKKNNLGAIAFLNLAEA